MFVSIIILVQNAKRNKTSLNGVEKIMIDCEKIRVEFDKINTDDFCAWLLHYHIDMFKRLHAEYLKDACLTPDEKKDFRIDFDLIKKELKQKG